MPDLQEVTTPPPPAPELGAFCPASIAAHDAWVADVTRWWADVAADTATAFMPPPRLPAHPPERLVRGPIPCPAPELVGRTENPETGEMEGGYMGCPHEAGHTGLSCRTCGRAYQEA